MQMLTPSIHSTAIKPGAGADPWVLQYGDYYYLLYTTGGDVQVTRSSNLAQWAESGTVVYTPPSGYTDVWAPELHYINGQFYIYVAMAQNGDNASHHVLQGMSTTDPLQRFNVSLSGPFVFDRLSAVGLTVGGGPPVGRSDHVV